MPKTIAHAVNLLLLLFISINGLSQTETFDIVTYTLQKDFKKDWNELVVIPFKGEANPKTETQSTPDGWKAVAGASLVKMDGVDVYITLTTFSGFGKIFSIRSSLNEQSYADAVGALIATMKLDKTVKSTG